MPEAARVGSFDALRELRAALVALGDQVRSGLGEAQAELTRAADWLGSDRRAYWRQQLTLRTEEYNRARRELNSRRSERTPLGGHYSCVEEEKAFQRARRRLDEAREKSEAVRRWSRRLEEATFAWQPLAQGLASSVEIDLPAALARLDAMLAALDAYRAGGPPPDWVASEALPTDDMRRPPDADNPGGFGDRPRATGSGAAASDEDQP